MDEPNPKPATTPENDSQPVRVTVGGASSPANENPAPAPASTFTPQSQQPAQPKTPYEPQRAPSNGAATPPPGRPVTSSPKRSGRGKRWLKTLLFLIIIAALAAGGWYAYQKYKDGSKASDTKAQSKDIPLLRVGLLQPDYGSLYPDMSVNNYGYTINSQMFEGLVRYEDKSKIVPALAIDWTNPDSRTWNFTIKDNVKFHNGHTMSAEDVKFSLDKVLAGQTDLAEVFASTIDTVTVSGGNQVKITTSEPDPTLLNKLSFLYIIDSKANQGDEPSMAGTGPYRIRPGSKPDEKRVEMVAFDGYHGGKPKTRALSFGGADEPAQLTKAYQDGTYDIVGYLTPEELKAAKGTEFTTNASNVNFIGFNTVKPGPLQNKLVREAIRYAVDPVAIGKARGSEVTPLSQMIPKSIPGYNPDIPTYKQDIPKAKELLAQAGYPNGVTIRFSVSSDSTAATTEISNQLKQAGITATIDAHTDFDEYIDYFSSGQADMYTIDYTSDTLDGLDIYKTTLPATNYSNPQLTTLLDQAGGTVDPAKRLKLLQDAAVVINEDIPTVPLSTQNDLWLMKRDYNIKQDMPSSYMPVYFYKVQQK